MNYDTYDLLNLRLTTVTTHGMTSTIYDTYDLRHLPDLRQLPISTLTNYDLRHIPLTKLTNYDL